MKKLAFVIHGTHKGRHVNPLPKLKMTGKQHWMPKAREYVAYKEHVRGAFLGACMDAGLIDHKDYKAFLYALDGKPILKTAGKCRMDIVITWSNKIHGDPENIFGAIADALFVNDKHLAGDFDFKYAEDGNAKVEAIIYFEVHEMGKPQTK